jgi:glycosyltransferase involved in cell wall biosynthesis
VKIAVVAPSPVPFGAGGAEKLWWGLVDNITKHTNHQCELIKVPIKENDFWSLIDAYQAFYTLDLSHFDMVISGKYPGWMVQHPNHHIYMLHCLRGFYDCFHFMGLPEQYSTTDPVLNDFLDKVRKQLLSPAEVFQTLKAMQLDDSLPGDLFAFPGAFSRELILYFDGWALKNTQRFSAISQTVANRKEYFPPGACVDVNYPPSTLVGFTNTSQQYFFTASRLDDAKRIKIIVQGYLKTTTDIPLKIAGTGPLAEELATLAADDKRIEFVGYVSDLELVQYYSNAYAIVFIPYDEDYGLITIEAMKSEKPVITFSDAGGVTEFVEHGVTGLTSEPEVDLLAANIDKLASNRALCKKMGQAAKQKVVDVNWINTIDRLLNPEKQQLGQSTSHLIAPQSTEEQSASNTLGKITVVSTYCFYPPQGGGQNRIFYLYKEIAKHMRVDIICLAHESETYESVEVALNLFQIKVPKSQEHAIKEWRIEEQAGIPVTDIAMISLYNETAKLKQTIQQSLLTSQLVVCSHPYLYPMLKAFSTIPIVHESHNVEFLLKQQMLKDSTHNQQLLETLRTAEAQACNETVLTTVCAQDDALRFAQLYDYDSQSTVVVANGVDLSSVKYLSTEQRKVLKTTLGIAHQKLAIFIGSWHQPNIEAVDEIIKMAPELSDFSFVVIGSVGGYYKEHKIPKNMAFAGLVTDEEKQLFLSTADVALNPMLTGSGTNLKMLDYMVAGVPVVSTEIGARGLNIPTDLIVIGETAQFKQMIEYATDAVDTHAASTYATDHFNWQRIAAIYLDALLKIGNKATKN